MPSPFDAMEAWYASVADNGKEQFGEQVAWHLRNAYVFNTQEYFVMGRPTKLMPTRAMTEKAIAYRVAFPPGECNCWYFHGLSGNLASVWKVLPYDLKWMAYHRYVNGKAQLYVRPLDAFRRRAMKLDSGRN